MVPAKRSTGASRSSIEGWARAHQRGILRAMLVLYQPQGAWGLPSTSPFCIKLETWLRMAQLPYTIEHTGPQRSPKGKVPYLRDGELVLSDSQFILEHLTVRYDVRLDAQLTEQERTQALLLRVLAEEHLYFLLAHFRWSGEASWPHVRAAFLGYFPPGVGPLVLPLLRRRVLTITQAQGLGRHTPGELHALFQRALDALSVSLGAQPYFLGTQPTSLDATMYGMLTSLLWVPWDTAETRYARSQGNLVAYCQRMRERYWP